MSGTPPLVPEPDIPGAERREKERDKEKDWSLDWKRGKQKRENDREERKIKWLRRTNNCVTLMLSEY